MRVYKVALQDDGVRACVFGNCTKWRARAKNVFGERAALAWRQSRLLRFLHSASQCEAKSGKQKAIAVKPAL
jgi:hypothetical protein